MLLTFENISHLKDYSVFFRKLLLVFHHSGTSKLIGPSGFCMFKEQRVQRVTATAKENSGGIIDIDALEERKIYSYTTCIK